LSDDPPAMMALVPIPRDGQLRRVKHAGVRRGVF
jgi:hypothetical protein